MNNTIRPTSAIRSEKLESLLAPIFLQSGVDEDRSQHAGDFQHRSEQKVHALDERIRGVARKDSGTNQTNPEGSHERRTLTGALRKSLVESVGEGSDEHSRKNEIQVLQEGIGPITEFADELRDVRIPRLSRARHDDDGDEEERGD